MGVSLVLHPRNPTPPTAHGMRYFVATAEGQEPVWWFGGGMDLTPYYGEVDDAVHFHRTCQQALQPFGEHYHPQPQSLVRPLFLPQAPRRTARRGRIFFDDLNEGGFDHCFAPHPGGGRTLCARLPAHRRTPLPTRLRRARTRLANLPPWPL